ncbi:four-helix bundle copper-binding protein [Nocardioides caldifontis]|uniref:four-helix bundle copper-binding protein n=1 Tax=Nocardioides caldifontis TaxID=2588938 RepID=UPI0011E01887|nr:four-helix bundle copper-binding protein [Nocardioides caldifontis]
MTHHIGAMLEAHAGQIDLDKDALAECIAACFQCAQACTACADACLSEEMVAELRKCIRTDLDCADICGTSGRVLSRHTAYDANLTRAMLTACAQACKACGDECAGHAEMHEHCRICAEACRRCEQACNRLLEQIG